MSIRGLTRLRHWFPKYARKICLKFNQDWYYLENHTFNRIDIESTVLNEDDFAIAFFLDGSTFETLTPGTGPHGNYAHKMRRDNHYLTQCAVYSGYKEKSRINYAIFDDC